MKLSSANIEPGPKAQLSTPKEKVKENLLNVQCDKIEMTVFRQRSINTYDGLKHEKGFNLNICLKINLNHTLLYKLTNE